VHIDLVKSRGDLYIARHVQHRKDWRAAWSYQRINAGYAVVEVVDAILRTTLPTRDLRARDQGTSYPRPRGIRPTLVPASFFFKLLAHDGSEPVVDCCVNCGRKGPWWPLTPRWWNTL